MHREARSLEGFASQWYTEGLFFGCFTLFSVYFVIFLLITSKWSHTVSLQNIEEQIALEQVAFSMVYDRTREPSSETVCFRVPDFFFKTMLCFAIFRSLSRPMHIDTRKHSVRSMSTLLHPKACFFLCVKIAYLSIFGDFKNRVFWVPDFFKKIGDSKHYIFCYVSDFEQSDAQWCQKTFCQVNVNFDGSEGMLFFMKIACLSTFGDFKNCVFWVP